MSYNTFFGACPIASTGDSLDPCPDHRVGELRGSSRSGVFGHVVSDLLNALPGHESLRFLAGEPCSLRQRNTDAQTTWTILDGGSLPLVVAQLDSLLAASRERACVIATSVCFGTEFLTPDDIRGIVASAGECTDLNAEAPNGEDGDTAAFVYCTLASLRGLLQRAITHSVRMAVFTWSPG